MNKAIITIALLLAGCGPVVFDVDVQVSGDGSSGGTDGMLDASSTGASMSGGQDSDGGTGSSGSGLGSSSGGSTSEDTGSGSSSGSGSTTDSTDGCLITHDGCYCDGMPVDLAVCECAFNRDGVCVCLGLSTKDIWCET